MNLCNPGLGSFLYQLAFFITMVLCMCLVHVMHKKDKAGR